MVHRDEYRQMMLAGTVSFPATFPQLGKLTVQLEELPAKDAKQVAFLVVSESPSARVTLVRRVMVNSVRAIFLPRDPRHVNYGDGDWLLGDEVLPGLQSRLAQGDSLHGIAFVPENEPSMLNVSVGMTAAESAQYYPPLPNDPAHNHYNAWPAGTAAHSLAALRSGAGSCLPMSSEVHACATEEIESGACAEECEVGSCFAEEELCRGLAACRSADDLHEVMQAIQQSMSSPRSFASCNAFSADM